MSDPATAFLVGGYVGIGLMLAGWLAFSEHPITGEYPERHQQAAFFGFVPLLWGFLVFVVVTEVVLE